VDEIYGYALKLLRSRDYTVAKLAEKLEARFGPVPDQVIQKLLTKNFLNDRRFAENYVSRRKDRGGAVLRDDLIARGIAPHLADEVVSKADRPSLRESLTARMNSLNLRLPLQPRDAARLFRALLRLGYDEDAIQEEIERAQSQK
jgi:SOS response regulatory protein OraA/RecX